MKRRALFTLLAAVSFLSTAESAESDSSLQTSSLATVHLLATARASGGGAPDGVQFLFLVKRGAGVDGPFTLKETRDFTVAGSSYGEMTQTALGQKFEPRTNVDNAEAFFTKQPGMRGLAPDDIAGGYILTLAIRGATLAAGSNIEVTVHVGFAKAVEPFRFNVPAPPGPGAAPKP